MSSILLKWGIFNALHLNKMENIHESNMFDAAAGGRPEKCCHLTAERETKRLALDWT